MQVEEETLSLLCAESSDNDEINDYLHKIIEEILFDEAIEFMWLIRSGQLSLEDLYNVQSFAEPSSPQIKIESTLKKTQITGSAGGISSSSSNWMNRTVMCPLCKESVAGVRYAPHLERCMNGGKRGVRRHYDFLHDNAVSLPYYSSKPKQKKEFVDPFPDSLVIRVRVKNGGPVGPPLRHGATLEEFEATRTEFLSAIESGSVPSNFRNFYSHNSHSNSNFSQKKKLKMS